MLDNSDIRPAEKSIRLFKHLSDVLAMHRHQAPMAHLSQEQQIAIRETVGEFLLLMQAKEVFEIMSGASTLAEHIHEILDEVPEPIPPSKDHVELVIGKRDGTETEG
jgi:hypothetical protein